MTVAWLFERMTQWREQPAIVWHDKPFSYGDLLDRIDGWAQSLGERGVVPGQVAALEGDYSPNACALLLALVGMNAIVVPLTKAVEAHRAEFMQIAEAQVLISFDDDDNWSFEQQPRDVGNPLIRSLIEQEQPGLVVFSSGSTGKNKAVLHNFNALLEKFKIPRHRKCALTFLLLDHLGGINTLLYSLSNGGTVVSVQSRDPEVICRAIERHKIQTLPASPTFLNLLLISEAYRDYDLSSLELITYGTEVMPETTLRRIREIFPNISLLQTYGLSELGVLRSKSRSSDSLWVKVGGEGFETKVADGVLWIRAQSAMVGYLNAPSPFDEQGWMNTQDEVEVDGDYIRILGRRSEIINVGGQKVYPAEVESVLLQMPNVRDVVVYSEKNPVIGQIVAARINVFEAEELKHLKQRLRAFCKDKLATYKIPIKVEVSGQEQFNARFKKLRQK
jgi:acyl-CoA synthetase (AMP-forming)/AMP-acid ligase II